MTVTIKLEETVGNLRVMEARQFDFDSLINLVNPQEYLFSEILNLKDKVFNKLKNEYKDLS